MYWSEGTGKNRKIIRRLILQDEVWTRNFYEFKARTYSLIRFARCFVLTFIYTVQRTDIVVIIIFRVESKK